MAYQIEAQKSQMNMCKGHRVNLSKNMQKSNIQGSEVKIK